MLCLRQNKSPSYDKCNQTVTVYHQNADKTIIRTVYEKNSFLDFRKNENVEKIGSTEVNSFLLVIHSSTTTLYNQDKVFLGVGPEAIDWASFIPTKVAGLVVIKYVDPKYWQGTQCHVEAGG